MTVPVFGMAKCAQGAKEDEGGTSCPQVRVTQEKVEGQARKEKNKRESKSDDQRQRPIQAMGLNSLKINSLAKASCVDEMHQKKTAPRRSCLRAVVEVRQIRRGRRFLRPS